MLFFRNKKTGFLSVIAITALFLLFYAGDKEYLQEKSADKVWSELSGTIDQIVSKGDFVTYKDMQPVGAKWQKYSNRFSEYVVQLNTRNEPNIRNRYLLSTDFREIDTRVVVHFVISEQNTGQLVEEKELITEPIKYTSIIPAVLALFLCFATASPLISVSCSLLLGSILYNGGSIIMGTKELFYKYLPYSLVGNNLNIVLFLLTMLMFLRILAGAGGFRDLVNSKSPTKYLLLPFLYFHPYAGVTASAWMRQSFDKTNLRPLRSSFITHVLAMLASAVLIYNYKGLGLTLFLTSLQFKFFSIAVIAMMLFFFMFKKTNASMEIVSSSDQEPLFQNKDLIKAKTNLGVSFLALFLLLFAVFFLFIGAIRVDVDSDSFRVAHLKNYLIYSNVSSALVLSSLASLLAVVIYSLRTKLLNTKDLFGYLGETSKNVTYYMLLLLVSFSFAKLLNDMGSAYYIISLFKVKAGTPFFPLVCFIISTLTTFMSGNGLIGFSIMIPILLPVAGQMGADAVAVAAIIEGCIAGELLSPYSPTAIMVCSIFKINTVKHSSSMFPYIGSSIVISSLVGFMLFGRGLPIWGIYSIIFLVFLAIMFKKPKKQAGSVCAKV